MKKNKSIVFAVLFVFYFCAGLSFSPAKTTGTDNLKTKINGFMKKVWESKSPYRLLRENKQEILSWGKEGIEILLKYPVNGRSSWDKDKVKNALEMFGPKAVPFLKKAVDEPFDENFKINLSVYFNIIREYPEYGDWLTRKILSWETTHRQRFNHALNQHIFYMNYWKMVAQWPASLGFLKYFFSMADEDDLEDLRFSGSRTEGLLKKRILPTFARLFSDYYEKETGLLYDYKDRWQEIFDPWGIVSPRERRKKEQKSEPVYPCPYDPRSLPYIYQHLAVKESMNWVDEDGLFSRLPMELLNIFPIDRDDEAVGFLKSYIWFSENNLWVDAACILSTFLSSSELERFGSALTGMGKKEKGNHLLELTRQPCDQFTETAAQNTAKIVAFPLDSPYLTFVPKMKSGMDYLYTSEYFDENYMSFLLEELEYISQKGLKKQSPQVQKVLQNRPLLEKLLAMDILSNDETLPDAFFLKVLDAGERDGWLRTAALQALRRRGTVLSKDRLEKLLKSSDPFVVFYALYWVETDDKDRFGDTLKQLACQGKSVFQKNVLKKIYQCFGYKELKKIISQVKEENLSIISLKYYLQKAFENKDKAVLARRFHIKEKPGIMIPVVYALFALDKQETLVKIRQFLTKEYDYFQEKGSRRIDDFVMEHLLTMVVESPVRSDIPPLAVFVNTGFFVDESKKALEYMVPAITKNDIRWMEGLISRYRLCESIVRHYKPEFLDYIKYCSKRRQSGIAEIMLKSEHEDLKPLWRNYIKKVEKEKPPKKKDELLKAVFIDDDYTTRKSFIKDVTEIEDTAAVKELTWYAVNGDDATALYAMRALLDYPGFKDDINRLMKEKLQVDDPFMKVPAIAWFARQGDVSILPLLEVLLYKHPVPRYILIDYLPHLPPEKTVPMVANVIRNRNFDVWMKIDHVLKSAAETHPGVLARFIDDPDIEVKKKIFQALKHAKGFTGWKKVRKYLESENTPLALYAFEALRGREKWQKKDLKALISLYQRVKSLTVKIDILEAVGRINRPAGRNFLRSAAQSDPLTSEYVALYSSLFDKEKFLSIVRTTEDINIFKQGVRYLRTFGRDGSYVKLLMDMIYNSSDEPRKYYKRLDKLLQPGEVEEKKEKPRITIKIPLEIQKAYQAADIKIPTMDKKNTRFNRTFRFKNCFAYLWEGPLTTNEKWRTHVSFSTDLEKWSVPVSFSEVMRMEHLSMAELPGSRYLVYYLRCTDPDSLSQPRPFFRLLNNEGRFEIGYFPLKNNLTFSEITVFYRDGKYYMACITERGCYGVKKRIQVYVSPDLKNWSTEVKHINFMENVRSLNVRSFEPNGHFLLSRDNLYFSNDLFHWERIHTFGGYYFLDLVKMKDKYCAVLESKRYGFWEIYLSFSNDLYQWSEPLYTGMPAASGCCVHEGRLHLFYGLRAAALNLDTVKKDSDSDGLTDVEEEILFTNMNSKDTDGDGVSDKEDLNPLRCPSPTLTETMEIRQFLVDYYLEWGSTFGLGGILIVISDSAETQSYKNVKMKTLSFNPEEYEVYYNRFKQRGNFFRIRFSRIELSKDKKSAVVEMSYHYAGLAAAGYEVKLKKINNKWKVLLFRTTWIL